MTNITYNKEIPLTQFAQELKNFTDGTAFDYSESQHLVVLLNKLNIKDITLTRQATIIIHPQENTFNYNNIPKDRRFFIYTTLIGIFLFNDSLEHPAFNLIKNLSPTIFMDSSIKMLYRSIRKNLSESKLNVIFNALTPLCQILLHNNTPLTYDMGDLTEAEIMDRLSLPEYLEMLKLADSELESYLIDSAQDLPVVDYTSLDKIMPSSNPNSARKLSDEVIKRFGPGLTLAVDQDGNSISLDEIDLDEIGSMEAVNAKTGQRVDLTDMLDDLKSSFSSDSGSQPEVYKTPDATIKTCQETEDELLKHFNRN